jgi:hypothetical protein
VTLNIDGQNGVFTAATPKNYTWPGIYTRPIALAEGLRVGD